MAIQIKVPEHVASAVRKRVAATPEDGGTLPSVPVFEGTEDDVLPELDVPPPDQGAADTQKLDLATLTPAIAVAGDERRPRWARVRNSARLQLAVMVIAGSMVLVGLYAFDEPPHEAPIKKKEGAEERRCHVPLQGGLHFVARFSGPARISSAAAYTNPTARERRADSEGIERWHKGDLSGAGRRRTDLAGDRRRFGDPGRRSIMRSR